MFKWIILKLFKNIVIDWIIKQINDSKFEEMLVTKANELIDIPKMNEKEEKEYFKNLYKTVKIAVNEYLEKLKIE